MAVARVVHCQREPRLGAPSDARRIVCDTMPSKDRKRPRAAATAGGRTREVSPMPTRKRSRVAEARERAGLTQPALAERIGVGRATIARIEAGGVSPRVAVALALSRELGESVEALFGGGA